MQRLIIFENHHSDVVFDFLNPPPATNATARHLLCEAALFGNPLTPFTLHLWPLPKDALKVLRGLHVP
jgi:hypothetical protein